MMPDTLAPNSAWGGGYVTDLRYEHGFYAQQSPGQLQAACLVAGVRWEAPAEGAHYLELGCGMGLGALVTAASNPSWQVTALDFNPAHIAAARGLARAAALDNISFIEADLADFAESAATEALPEAHVVSMHGVWSWVAPEVRAGIVRLLALRLAAGGVLHVSYNALPGWQGALALQRLVREAGLRTAARSDRQAQAGFAILKDLLAAGAPGLGRDPRLAAMVDPLSQHSASYLAHEFMNGHWSPCWQADVAGALAAAKLDWAGSAGLLETFPELAMDAAQREIHDRFDDPLMRELVKDACLAPMLRHDIYVRGAVRLSAAARDRALGALHLGLSVPLAAARMEVDVGAGTAKFSPALYGPVLRRLSEGPCLVRDLFRLPEVTVERENPAELVAMLIGSRQACVVARPGSGPGEAAMRLNRALVGEFAMLENVNRGAALASQQVGSGIAVSAPTLHGAGRFLAGGGEESVADWMAQFAPDVPEEVASQLRDAFAAVQAQTLPMLRALGYLPRLGEVTPCA